MYLFGFNIRRASTVKSRMELAAKDFTLGKAIDFRMFCEFNGVYNARMFGICIYRSSNEFDKIFKDYPNLKSHLVRWHHKVS